MKRGTIENVKTKRLARLLQIELLHAVGILESLWHWASKNAQDGVLGRFLPEEIADGIYYPEHRDIHELISALIQAKGKSGHGFLEMHQKYGLVIHDWQEHADQAVRKYLKNHRMNFWDGSPAYGKKVQEQEDSEAQETQETPECGDIFQLKTRTKTSKKPKLLPPPENPVSQTVDFSSQTADFSSQNGLADDPKPVPVPVPVPEIKERGAVPALQSPKSAKKKSNLEDQTYPAVLDTEEFREAWTKHWMSRKTKLLPESVEEMLNYLAGFGHAVALEAVKTSFRMGWTGIFPEKHVATTGGARAAPAAEAEKRLKAYQDPESFFGSK